MWGPARPEAPSEKVRVHPLSLAGVSAADKLDAVREKLAAAEAQVMVVSALDEVCYLLNLRGADIAHNPVTLSYVLVSADACTLFVDRAKLSDDVVTYLSESGVTVADYEGVVAAVEEHVGAGDKVMVDTARVNHGEFRIAIAIASPTTPHTKQPTVPPERVPKRPTDAPPATSHPPHHPPHPPTLTPLYQVCAC